MAFSRRRRRKGIFRTLRFSARLRRNAEAVHSRGNRVELFQNGGDFFPSLFQSFLSARESICAEFYIIRNDDTGNAFGDSLIAAVARGVSVFLIYDYLGCIDTPSSYFRRLENGGVRCLPFNRLTFKKLHWLDTRDHRKLAVIDGQTAFICSLNVGDEYAGFGDSLRRWRDVGMRMDGPAVRELQTIFRLTWESEGGPIDALPPHQPVPLEAGDAEVTIVNGTPHHTRSVIRSAFRLAMAGAAERIRIITPYFVPGPSIVRSLLRAASAGVQVQIILPSISDVPFVKTAGRAYLAPLLKAGVEIFERQGTVLHAKVMLIDDCWVTVGSANFDFRSFHRNFEINVIVDSREFGIQVQRMFEDDLIKSRRISFTEYEKRGLFERFLELLCDPISRFL